MQIKNRIQKLEQYYFRYEQRLGIVVETIDEELSINKEKSDPEALREFYHNLKLAYGTKEEERRS